MIMPSQYVALRPALIKKHHLTPTLAIIYSALVDRMLSSRRNGATFFDTQRQAYFVSYSQPTMAADWLISASTVQRAYEQLEQRGLLVKRHRNNASDRLYLPEMEGWLYRGSFKMTKPGFSFCQSNQLTLTQETQFTTKTLNTRKIAKRPSSQSIVPTEAPAKPVTPVVPAESHSTAIVNDLTFTSLTQSLTTQGGIPADAASLMADLSYHDPATLHEMARIVYQAKAAVKTSAERALGQLGYQATRWEQNTIMATDFKTAVARIITAAYRKNRRHWQGYAYSSFVQFFEETTNAWLKERQQVV